MIDKQKRALAVHDISCVGRCSLTVALPIICAAGVDCSVLPTAVLSTHTGGFTGFTFRDLTEDIEPIENHWESLGLEFDSIYTGYLGSFEQIELVADMFDRFKRKDTLALVDPVMADNGILYPIFPKNFPEGMRKLCSKADIIIPNITEAVLMLGEDFREGPYERSYIEGLLDRLEKIGPKSIVLTGVCFDDKKLGAAARTNGNTTYSFEDRIDGYFHGTGDIFGSALLGALMNGKDLAEATHIAVKYTCKCISLTVEAKQERRYGVCFERAIPDYIKMLD